jgi:AcrR family transcriptional regulator
MVGRISRAEVIMQQPVPPSARDAAIDAFLQLLAERPWSEVSLADIAQRAGISLGDLRGAFASKGAIHAGFARRIDQAVLSEKTESDAFTEPARERLFDILMRRFDALLPYRAAIRSAREGLRRDPLSAAAWNRVEVNSAQWMMAAAGIEDTGPLGPVKAQALAVVFAAALPVWLEDDEPGSPKTMKVLDDQLRRAESLAKVSEGMERLLAPFARLRPRRRRRPEPEVESTDDFMEPI